MQKKTLKVVNNSIVDVHVFPGTWTGTIPFIFPKHTST